MPNENGTFVLAGGGTGGHVFPAIAVAREIRRRRPSARILFVGTRKGFEAVIAPREGFPIEFVSASGFVGRGPLAKARAISDLVAGIAQSRRILARERASAVLGVGGYASLPVVAAARLCRIPAMIQEQNSVPGIANRLGARMARVTAAGFEAACRRLAGRCVWTGNPAREEFFRVPAPPGGRRVLLFGGSQGARVLNRAIVEAAPALAAGVEVTAQTGERELENVRAALGPYPAITAVPFVDEMAEAFGRADLVVARAGALTLAEVAAAGRPSILVPFAAATHAHQEENARVFERAGAAVVIAETDIDGATLARTIAELLGDPDRLRRMGDAARTLAKPDAAARIVDLLFEIAA
ncbi:MAG TPA: undecaprenyldiphospho-muramoylpentapeptide beta-N-acetylglucosaminyltransferase [Thermoanaerobaculia bacterium]|nr:undecaprenyldiphospho-muramoylpentapeptide beta-N-acetylglucosaminyltransferase [Thermoanaerobaculia bacterium]